MLNTTATLRRAPSELRQRHARYYNRQEQAGAKRSGAAT
jgi:hypothetical protein